MHDVTLINTLLKPAIVFRSIARESTKTSGVLQLIAPFILLIPPIFVWIGSGIFGWRMGTNEPIFLDTSARFIISFCYFLVLSTGYFSTVFIANWMGNTYGASKRLGTYFNLFTVVYLPLLVASIAHLYPNAFFNLLVLLPTLIWCMNLLYRGLPSALEISPQRGMLMASALVAWLLVGAVTILGLSVALWTIGLGPAIAV